MPSTTHDPHCWVYDVFLVISGKKQPNHRENTVHVALKEQPVRLEQLHNPRINGCP